MRSLFRLGNVVRRKPIEIEPEEILMDAVNIPGFRPELAEGRIERPISRRSFLGLGALVALGLFVTAGRLADLQLRRGEEFLKQANINKTYPTLIAAPRGIFYDRKLEKLVENAPAFTISLDPNALPSDEEFSRFLGRLASLVGGTMAEFAEANGLEPNEDFSRRNTWPLHTFIASGDLREVILELRAKPDAFPGVTIAEAGVRRYMLGSAAGHLLGYVGLPSREDLARSENIRPSEVLGKTGLEFQYESVLRGQAGEKLVEVDATGEVKRERFTVKPEPGENMVLEIDAGLQRFAAEALKRHLGALGKRAGAIVAIDPRDGAVRALVSAPGYDPNLFGRGVSGKEFSRLRNEPASPLFNRAITGGYPSGSTIKPMLAIAALEEGTIDPGRTIYDPGYISVPNPYDAQHPTIFKDWKALGVVDMRRAIAMSANVYFYTIGGGYGDIPGLGIERIGKWLRRFGWGSPLGIDLPGEYGGLIPDPEKKKTIRPKDPVWRIGDTYITSIGQGDLQATPLQLAAATAAIANGGTLWKPRLAHAVLDQNGGTVRMFAPEAIRRDIARPESLKVVREGMREAVTKGSATALAGLFFPVAGKTGTAQTGAYGKNHGWFVGYAPADDPELVIAVLVEEGTGGSTDAVPIAKEVLYYYFTESSNSHLTGG